ncbi:hypothetical protein CsSME_00014826 [Camellia sinensis var. sinensis]
MREVDRRTLTYWRERDQGRDRLKEEALMCSKEINRRSPNLRYSSSSSLSFVFSILLPSLRLLCPHLLCSSSLLLWFFFSVSSLSPPSSVLPFSDFTPLFHFSLSLSLFPVSLPSFIS